MLNIIELDYKIVYLIYIDPNLSFIFAIILFTIIGINSVLFFNVIAAAYLLNITMCDELKQKIN